jgi:hypothetical protein
LALLNNISLGWKGLPVANTKDYYKHLSIMSIKRCITLAQAADPKNLHKINTKIDKMVKWQSHLNSLELSTI